MKLCGLRTDRWTEKRSGLWKGRWSGLQIDGRFTDGRVVYGQTDGRMEWFTYGLTDGSGLQTNRKSGLRTNRLRGGLQMDRVVYGWTWEWFTEDGWGGLRQDGWNGLWTDGLSGLPTDGWSGLHTDGWQEWFMNERSGLWTSRWSGGLQTKRRSGGLWTEGRDVGYGHAVVPGGLWTDG